MALHPKADLILEGRLTETPNYSLKIMWIRSHRQPRRISILDHNVRISFDYKQPLSSADLIRIDRINKSAKKEPELQNSDRKRYNGQDESEEIDFVIKRDDKMNYPYTGTPAVKNVSKVMFRDERRHLDDPQYLRIENGNDNLTFTSPFKQKMHQQSGNTYGDVYSNRFNQTSNSMQKTFTPAKPTIGGISTYYAYTQSPRMGQYGEYSDVNNHFENLDQLAKGQERDINYLLGIGPKPSQVQRVHFNERGTKTTPKPKFGLDPSRFNYTKMLNQDRNIESASLVPQLLTDYPELQKKEVDFKLLNNEKEITDGMLTISQNLLEETKRSLAKIKSASAIKISKDSPIKSLTRPAKSPNVFDVVKSEKKSLKDNYEVDLDAAKTSQNSPNGKGTFTSYELVDNLKDKAGTRQSDNQQVNKNVPEYQQSGYRQNQLINQSNINQVPGDPRTSNLGNEVQGAWGKQPTGQVQASNISNPDVSKNSSHYDKDRYGAMQNSSYNPSNIGNNQDRWQKPVEDQAKPGDGYTQTYTYKQSTTTGNSPNPVVTSSTVIENNRPTYENTTIAGNNDTTKPYTYSGTSYNNSMYVPGSNLSQYNPPADTHNDVSYNKQTVTKTSFGPGGEQTKVTTTIIKDGKTELLGQTAGNRVADITTSAYNNPYRQSRDLSATRIDEYQAPMPNLASHTTTTQRHTTTTNYY